MGLFRVRGRLTGPAGRSEGAELLVDTGGTLLVVPRSLAERLELATRRAQRMLIAGGQRASGLWPKEAWHSVGRTLPARPKVSERGAGFCREALVSRSCYTAPRAAPPFLYDSLQVALAGWRGDCR